MNKFWRLAIAFLFFYGQTPVVLAQIDRDQNGEISDEEVIIIKEKELKLPEAARNFEKITIPVKPPTPQPQRYSFQEFKANLQPIEPRMSVARLPQDELQKLYGTYLKGGLGNYATTYLEAFHNSKRTNDYAYGVHFKHLASALGPIKNSGNGENKFAGYGQYFNEKYVLSGRIDYARERYNYYGYDRRLREVSKDTTRQIYSTIGFAANLQNATDSAKFAYKGGFSFYNFGDSQKNRESEFGLNLNSRYTLNENMAILLNTELALLQYKSDTNSIGRNYIALRPAFHYKKDAFSAKIGFNLGVSNDTAKNATKTAIYPILALDYQLLEGKASVFAALSGDLEKRTFRNTVADNPFVASALPLSHSNKLLDLNLGIKGATSSLAYSLSGGYQEYKMLPFFINNPKDSARFTLTYDSLKTKVSRFSGEIAYNKQENVRVALKTDFYGYKTQKIEKAWHRPSFRTSINTRYNFKNKIYVDFGIYYIGTQYARNPVTGKTQELKAITDIDLKIDYKFSDKYSAFINFDNIISQKNQRYLYYQSRGILVMLGLSASL